MIIYTAELLDRHPGEDRDPE